MWRFAHHRSAIASDGGGPSSYFWYFPRAVISPDGKFALFTSNWEKTFGASVTGEPGGDYRTDVFIVALVAPPFGGFTDDPLIPGVTVVKASHLAELRLRVDALRVRFGVGVYAWTDPGLPVGTTIKATHVHELRSALQQAYAAAGLAPPAYTEQAVTVIKAAHIHELRSAVVSLEES